LKLFKFLPITKEKFSRSKAHLESIWVKQQHLARACENEKFISQQQQQQQSQHIASQ
jgi:hypothetical protein